MSLNVYSYTTYVVLEARDLSVIDGKKSYSAYCLIDLPGNDTVRTHSTKDNKWNQSCTLYVITLMMNKLFGVPANTY